MLISRWFFFACQGFAVGSGAYIYKIVLERAEKGKKIP